MSSDAKPSIPGAWHDRFTRPTVEALLHGLGPEASPIFETVRTSLLGRERVQEELVHMGVPWRWSLRYTMDADDRFAYLIPEPGRPKFSLPLPEAFIESMPLRKLSKGVRDGLVHARIVGGVIWAEWELTSRPQAEELASLAASKHEALLAGA